ncbi:Tyrosine recombinase XerC (plasmid) [Caballeronia sp. SBC1]|nr:Tyrosine recombinase XerC [Caballeronia sp. SBC2]QIN64318.1 Tyrosine recombinase XerC [Caballeronia sp. SBC1]
MGSGSDHRQPAQTNVPFIRKENVMETTAINTPGRVPWNKSKFTGQKPPLKLKEIWAIRIRLQLSARTRDLAIFNLAIDSKLRACDLTKLRVRNICHGQHVASRATVMQQKTQRPVQFELTEQTRDSAEAWIRTAGLSQSDFLFPSRIHESPHLSTRQYARLVHRWIASIGLDDTAYGTHTMRRTKASLIYRRTKNLRAVQLLLGHSKLESTVRYLGIEVDDALEMAEQTEV